MAKPPTCQAGGAPTPPAVYSCVHGDNADLIAQVVRKYVRPGDSILDVTYGRGSFGKKWDRAKFRLVTADLDRPAQVSK